MVFFWGFRPYNNNRCVYVRDSVLYSTRGLSRDSRSQRTAQIVPGRLQAHSSAFKQMWRGSSVWRSWLGTDDKRSAASVGHSYRVSECREVVRAQLLRDSADSGGECRHFCSTCETGCRSGLRDAGEAKSSFPSQMTVRSCKSFGLLRGGIHRDCCRPQGPAGKLSPTF